MRPERSFCAQTPTVAAPPADAAPGPFAHSFSSPPPPRFFKRARRPVHPGVRRARQQRVRGQRPRAGAKPTRHGGRLLPRQGRNGRARRRSRSSPRAAGCAQPRRASNSAPSAAECAPAAAAPPSSAAAPNRRRPPPRARAARGGGRHRRADAGAAARAVGGGGSDAPGQAGRGGEAAGAPGPPPDCAPLHPRRCTYSSAT